MTFREQMIKEAYFLLSSIEQETNNKRKYELGEHLLEILEELDITVVNFKNLLETTQIVFTLPYSDTMGTDNKYPTSPELY